MSLVSRSYFEGDFLQDADHDLMVRMRTGDREAFASLVDRHQRPLYGFLRARVLRPDDAEDMVQEVFIRFYQARARFDSTALVRPWLMGIARNLLREHVRHIRRRREVAWTELCLELETIWPNADVAEDKLRWLPECLVDLGPSARQAIELHYRTGQKLTEIAGLLHRSEGAVKLLLHRARQALRDCLNLKQRQAEPHERR